VKRKRALLGSNSPRNSRSETHSDGPGAERNLKSIFEPRYQLPKYGIQISEPTRCLDNLMQLARSKGREASRIVDTSFSARLML
jgi:hypothetical protein